MFMMLGLLLLGLALDIWLSHKQAEKAQGKDGVPAQPPPTEPPDRPTSG